MKKLVAWITVLVLCIGAFAGCLAEEGEIGLLTLQGIDQEELNKNLKDVIFNVLPFSGYKYFDTFNNMITALATGAIEAIETDEYVAGYLFSRMEGFTRYICDELPVYQASFSMLLRGEDTELRDRISQVLLDMREDGTLDALKTQYIDDVIAGNEPEAVTPEHFQDADTIVVAVTGDRPPMDYFSTAGESIGFNTALVAEVAKRMGVNVELFSVDAGARAVALASGAADVVFWVGTGDFNNWENADSEDQPANTILTAPYLTGSIYYVVPADSPLVKQ